MLTKDYLTFHNATRMPTHVLLVIPSDQSNGESNFRRRQTRPEQCVAMFPEAPKEPSTSFSCQHLKIPIHHEIQSPVRIQDALTD